MNVAIDISPLSSGHKVRGVGFYLQHLKDALEKYFPEHTYTYFTKPNEIPSQVDVVHYPYFDPFFVTLPIIKKYPTVVTVHDLTPLLFPKKFPVGVKGTLKWSMQKLLLKQLDAIITDSESSSKDVMRLVGIPKNILHTAYLAAGEEFVRINDKGLRINEIRKKYDLPEKFALYVGDVTPNKNVPQLVRACLESKIPLVMVGKALAQEDFDHTNLWNADLVEYKKIIKGEKNIFVLGFIPTEDIVALYNAAVMTLLPSLYEGFGLPAVEAMQCGCPVVTSRGGSLKEVVGDAGYIVDPESRVSMKDGFEKVFSDANLQEDLRQKGLVQAKKFSWEKTAQQTLEVYKKIASEK